MQEKRESENGKRQERRYVKGRKVEKCEGEREKEVGK